MNELIITINPIKIIAMVVLVVATLVFIESLYRMVDYIKNKLKK